MSIRYQVLSLINCLALSAAYHWMAKVMNRLENTSSFPIKFFSEFWIQAKTLYILSVLLNRRTDIKLCLGNRHKTFLLLLAVKAGFVCWGRTSVPWHLKITCCQKTQEDICISQTRNGFINAKLFWANQTHLRSNILAWGTRGNQGPSGEAQCPGLTRGHQPCPRIRKP